MHLSRFLNFILKKMPKKTKKVNETPEQKVKNAHRAFLEYWVEESDIDENRIAEIAREDTNEWIEEYVVDFECDIDLEDDDDAED